MDSLSNSITWQGWSQKWGDWTTWFRKMDLAHEPLQRRLVSPTTGGERRIEKALTLAPKDPLTR